jgi:transcriptional regulator with XRE-family HTH domain
VWLGNGGTRLAALAPRRAETALALIHANHDGRQTMSDDIDFHLGKRMRRRRRLLGLTQQQLAESCGVRFQQIQKYECGANRVSAARLWRIASALEVPVNYFFEGLSDDVVVTPGPTRDESADLVRTYHALGERPRRRLLDLARNLNRDSDAA